MRAGLRNPVRVTVREKYSNSKVGKTIRLFACYLPQPWIFEGVQKLIRDLTY